MVPTIKQASLHPTSFALTNSQTSSPTITPTPIYPDSHLLQPKQPNMAPAKWTAERDQRLLLLLVDQIKVNGDAVAAAWQAKYGELAPRLFLRQNWGLTVI